MVISLEINKEVNFLMILYQIIKNQNKFENLSFNFPIELTKEDKKIMKTILRSGDISLNKIKENPKLNQIYEKNKKVWEKYWDDNLRDLMEIKEKLEERLNNFDFSVFEKVEKFFETQAPKNILIWICMGNESIVGTGNTFSPNLCVLFPRKFNNFTQESLDNDFAVLIHEILHLYQDLCNKKDKELIEKTARCFAPRGILINEDRVQGDENFMKFFNFVKKCFLENKTFSYVKKNTNL